MMASTGTRLRQTFKYPSDSEISDASREELDEEGKHLRPSRNSHSKTRALATLLHGPRVQRVFPVILISGFIAY